MNRIFLLIIYTLTVNTILPQEQDTSKLGAYFNALASNNKFMGSISLFKENNFYFKKQFGFSETIRPSLPDEETKYRIGSISKTFTAALIFKTIEEKKLSLTETIDTFFPTIKNANKITIENLLHHRSGIPDFTQNKEKYLSYHTQSKEENEMIEIISSYDSNFEPNTQASYSNSNYLLLSYILEKKYKTSYAQVLEEQLCTPLKLKNTYFTELVSIQKNEAYSYNFNKKWNKSPQTNGHIGLGAGGIVSTPTDLIKFYNALFNGQVLSIENLQRMTLIRDQFGMGLFQSNYYNLVSYGHNGGIDGFVSMVRYFPEEKIGFSITANGLDYNFNTIESVVAKSLFNQHYDVPVFTIYRPSSKELNQYIGSYSSDSYPVRIKVVKRKKQLTLLVENNPPMQLDAFAKGKFKFDEAGIIIEFIPSKNEMIIKQLGKTAILNKE